MGNAVLYMSMPVDGFIAGPNDGLDNGIGDGRERLHEWSGMDTEGSHNHVAARLSGVNRDVVDEVMATGAVVTGRRAFENAGGWEGDHHDGVPIFVLTRASPMSRCNGPR
jgi:dihydrofolate reductase